MSASASVTGQVILKKGMKIRSSVLIKKAVYHLGGTAVDDPVIEVSGNNIVVDFNGSIMEGNHAFQMPDEFKGLAIRVTGSNITIRNLIASGYKIGLVATGVTNLVIEQCNFSYNFRQHLDPSSQNKALEKVLSSQNENDEWLSYGAGIYLKDCQQAIVKYCKVTGGQNALLMTQCNNGKIYNNDLSFNSGIGIGIYQSKSNQFLFNKINFNVRGYTHGVESDGQGSAGFFVEQGSENIFYRNSATHCGNGILFPGKAEGQLNENGSNDNRIWSNDFSYAATNSIEIGFSRNVINGNRMFESDYGVRAFNLWESNISGNQFRNNKTGIAIEKGHHNQILSNIFYRDQVAIRLGNSNNDSNNHTGKSRNYLVSLNSFNENPLVYELSGTDSLFIFNNSYAGAGKVFLTDSTIGFIDSSEMELLDTTAAYPTVDKPNNPFKGSITLAGRKNILMTEWGPYDFTYPLIWNTNPAESSGQMEFEVLGPKGTWKIISAKGVKDISLTNGSFPSRFTASKTGDEDFIEIIAEFQGESHADIFGRRKAAGRPHRFIFRKNKD
jgi:parallel beta-helix repeat protein